MIVLNLVLDILKLGLPVCVGMLSSGASLQPTKRILGSFSLAEVTINAGLLTFWLNSECLYFLFFTISSLVNRLMLIVSLTIW